MPFTVLQCVNKDIIIICYEKIHIIILHSKYITVKKYE